MVYGGVDVSNPEVLKLLAPGVYECTLDNLRLKYESTTGKHIPSDGVLTRVKGEHLDVEEFDPASDYTLTGAFGSFDADLHWGQPGWGLDQYLQMIGYTPYVNLWHAPYDFRKSSVDFVEKDYPRLKALTEHVYQLNGNKKVAFAGVSMGGPYLSSFMLYLDQFPGWKEQYVDSMYTFAGVFGGAIYNLGTLIFGETYGIPYIDAAVFQRMYKSWGCGTWLTPMEGNENDRVTVRVKELDDSITEYTVDQLKDFFESVPDLADSMKMKRDYFNENTGNRVHQPYHDPGVKVHCFMNADTPTYDVIELDRSNIQAFDTEHNGEMTAHGEFTGDGVANYPELAVCRDWANTKVWETNGFPHASEMGDWDHMQYVAAHLTGNGENPISCTEKHFMETECSKESDVACPEGWIPEGEPTTDGCERQSRWCLGSGCDRYKQTCSKTDWWVCDDGQKCGPQNQQCFDNVAPTSTNVDLVSVGDCEETQVMSEGECRAYANMVGKKFELRSKTHKPGCYLKSVHDTDFVLYQLGGARGDAIPCSDNEPCVCFKGTSDDGGAVLAEEEVAVNVEDADQKDGKLPTENFPRYFVLFSAGALLGAWYFTRPKQDDERLPLLEHV
jgi:lysophospholipase-3